MPKSSSVRAWALWSLPARMRFYVLGVDPAAVAMTGLVWVSYPSPGWEDLVGAAWLGVCAATGVEFSRAVEQRRERYRCDRGPYRSFHGAWMLAAAVVLPPGLSCLLVAGCYLAVWLRVERFTLHRWVFSAAVSVVGTALAAALYRLLAEQGGVLPGWDGLAVLPAAAVVMLVNVPLAAGVPVLSSTQVGSPDTLVGGRGERGVGVVGLCLGVVTAGVYSVSPLLVPMVLPVLYLMQRSLLVGQLEQVARRDAKTGLLNSTYWHGLAEREAARAVRRAEPVSVLMVDLDHFKRVNDRFGHLAGDRVLCAVCEALTGSVREYDVVGRFGGEEFVVLCPCTGVEAARGLAERIRREIAALAVEVEPGVLCRLTVSVGVATWEPQAGCSPDLLAELLCAADGRVYAAKGAGRDRVAAVAVTTGVPVAAARCPRGARVSLAAGGGGGRP